MADLGSLLGNIATGQRNDQEFDIDNWVQDFENGFQNHLTLVMNPELREGYWGVGSENRPHIVELNVESNAQREEGYRVIEFFPNRDDRNESYILFGTPLELQTQVSMLWNIKRMLRLHSSDEQWVGSQLDEYLRDKPREEVAIQVWLSSYKRPPYYRKKEQIEYFTNRQVTIPCVIDNLSFNTIRNVCGGSDGQSWGEWTARAYISLKGKEKKGIHQMVAGGSTEAKALTNLTAFLTLTRCEVKSITTHHQQLTNDEKHLKKFDVYPAWIAVFNSKLAAVSAQGKKTLSGKQVSKRSRKLYIFQEKEPSWWSGILKDALKNPLD